MNKETLLYLYEKLEEQTIDELYMLSCLKASGFDKDKAYSLIPTLNDLWLKDFREFIDDFKRIAKDKKICLVCGKEKDDYQSAYCDECWEEEKKRLGVD